MVTRIRKTAQYSGAYNAVLLMAAPKEIYVPIALLKPDFLYVR